MEQHRGRILSASSSIDLQGAEYSGSSAASPKPRRKHVRAPRGRVISSEQLSWELTQHEAASSFEKKRAARQKEHSKQERADQRHYSLRGVAIRSFKVPEGGFSIGERFEKQRRIANKRRTSGTTEASRKFLQKRKADKNARRFKAQERTPPKDQTLKGLINRWRRTGNVRLLVPSWFQEKADQLKNLPPSYQRYFKRYLGILESNRNLIVKCVQGPVAPDLQAQLLSAGIEPNPGPGKKKHHNQRGRQIRWRQVDKKIADGRTEVAALAEKLSSDIPALARMSAAEDLVSLGFTSSDTVSEPEVLEPLDSAHQLASELAIGCARIYNERTDFMIFQQQEALQQLEESRDGVFLTQLLADLDPRIPLASLKPKLTFTPAMLRRARRNLRPFPSHFPHEFGPDLPDLPEEQVRDGVHVDPEEYAEYISRLVPDFDWDRGVSVQYSLTKDLVDRRFLNSSAIPCDGRRVVLGRIIFYSREQRPLLQWMQGPDRYETWFEWLNPLQRRFREHVVYFVPHLVGQAVSETPLSSNLDAAMLNVRQRLLRTPSLNISDRLLASYIAGSEEVYRFVVSNQLNADRVPAPGHLSTRWSETGSRKLSQEFSGTTAKFMQSDIDRPRCPYRRPKASSWTSNLLLYLLKYLIVPRIFAGLILVLFPGMRPSLLIGSILRLSGMDWLNGWVVICRNLGIFTDSRILWISMSFLFSILLRLVRSMITSRTARTTWVDGLN